MTKCRRWDCSGICRSSLHAFVAGTSAPGARVITDGWSGYPGLPDHDHQPKVVGATPAHLVLIWIHRVFSNLKRWALGTFHGLRRAHLCRYLDEFVFRWNRRRHTATAFDTLLGIGTRLRPAALVAAAAERGWRFPTLDPSTGIVMYGRPRCCKGKTDLNRR